MSLECSGDGGPDNMYQWQVNGCDSAGATSPTLLVANVQASDGGEYTCVVTNAAGSDSASTFLYVAPYFTTQPSNMLATTGSSIMLLCEAEAFPSPNYQWGRVDGDQIRADIINIASMLVIDSVMFEDAGAYYCNVSSLTETIRSLDATITGNL